MILRIIFSNFQKDLDQPSPILGSLQQFKQTICLMRNLNIHDIMSNVNLHALSQLIHAKMTTINITVSVTDMSACVRKSAANNVSECSEMCVSVGVFNQRFICLVQNLHFCHHLILSQMTSSLLLVVVASYSNAVSNSSSGVMSLYQQLPPYSRFALVDAGDVI